MDAVLPHVPPEELESVVEKIAEVLWESDWDCESESNYYEELLHPLMLRRGYIDEDDDWDE